MRINSSGVAVARKRDSGLLRLAARLAIIVALPALGGCQTTTSAPDSGGRVTETTTFAGIKISEEQVSPSSDYAPGYSERVARIQEKAALDAPSEEHGANNGQNGQGGQSSGQSSGGSSGPSPSDIRLKRDIIEVARLDNGLHLYRFRYNWADQEYVGVMAQEVEKVMPGAVSRGADGYLRVDYGQLGIRMESWDEWLREHPRQASLAN
jgi:hypothetical protein